MRAPTMWVRCVVLAATVLVQCGRVSSADSCGPGVDMPGVTVPKGDIVLEHGDPLQILCVLNPDHRLAQGVNASRLFFEHDGKPVPAEFVTVENSTTIRLYVERPPPSSSWYYCRLRTADADAAETNVCFNQVSVAFKPQEVGNFSCVSHNWQDLTCTWTKPLNYIKTQYTLGFQLPGRAGGRLLFGCPNNTDLTDNRCFWDQSTDPHYRQPYEYYYFKMTGENLLGNVTFPLIKFHHYTHVIPTAPVNLSLINRTTHSVCLEWAIPFPMQTFPPGVIHRVRHQSEWDPRDHWDEVNTAHMNTKTKTHLLNVTGLRHANALYDVKVEMKSAAAAAVGNEMVWSPPASITVKTKPTVPGAAPKTDVGSFEVSGGLHNRFVYLYWQHIPEHLKNGDNFEYRVYRVDEHGAEHLMVPSELTKAYAKFKSMNFDSHRFVVVSANREGRSVGQSTIYVPRRGESPAEPLSFTKIAFGNGTYELSWRPPPEFRNLTITNYTIFWCDNDRDRPYQCNGFLDWAHVPRGNQLWKINVPDKEKIYQFAISANTRSGSSGMVWASCTVIHDKVIGKMKNVWINRIDSRYIEVGWKLDCSDRVGMVTGFRISYCPIIGPHHIECKEPEQNTTIAGDSGTIHGRVNGLKPYTTYMVAVAVVTKSGDGLLSDPLLNTTLEAAPETPPRDVRVVSVTNTSVEVEWSPPLQTNGLLRYYLVHHDGGTVKVERDRTHVTLANLSSYANVSVGVSACTVACSERAAPPAGTAVTLVGYPSVMERPVVQFVNASQVSVAWRPPQHPRGPAQYYELLVQQRSGRANTTSLLVNSTGTDTLISVPACEHDGTTLAYVFSVRAVNVDADGRLYPGAWSPAGEGNCFNAAPARYMVFVIWIFVGLAVLSVCLAAAFAGKRLWHRCKVMQDVEVKLPPGLTPMSDKENHIQVHTWPVSDGHDAHKARPPAADEELLLDKVGGRNPSGDSSGCSSGHESVSSSVGTHLSCDSGTEVDQRPPTPDGVFSECAGWECSSVGAVRGDGSSDAYVRMGKLASAHSTPNLTELEGAGGAGGPWSSTGYISMPSSEEMAEPAGGYCRVGLDPAAPSAPRPPAKGYVSIASMSAASAPAAPGYVPHAAAKTPSYVALPPDSYCRLGLQGYTPLAEGAGGAGYVPHARLCHASAPTTSV